MNRGKMHSGKSGLVRISLLLFLAAAHGRRLANETILGFVLHVEKLSEDKSGIITQSYLCPRTDKIRHSRRPSLLQSNILIVS